MLFNPHQIVVLKKSSTNIIEVLTVGLPAGLDSEAAAAYLVAQIAAALKNMKLDGDVQEVPAEWEVVKGTSLSDYDAAGKLIRPEPPEEPAE